MFMLFLLVVFFFFFLMIRRPPRSTLFPTRRSSDLPFGALLWLLGGVDKGLHTLVTTPRPLEPDLRAAQRDMLLGVLDRKSTRLNSSHSQISYAVFCLKKKKQKHKSPCG